jgi:hypothetical protein
MKPYIKNRTHQGPQKIYFADYPDFRPNMTPEMMFVHGVFGGTYWRPIHSNVTHKDYKEEWKEFPELVEFADRDDHMRDYLESTTFDQKKNKYGVVAGSPLEYWEESGWINPQDPYGWVQWYCRFSAGRRTDDDKRQIKRWLGFAGPKGRYRRQLINRIKEFNTKYWDISVSPIIRQTLLQWGYELTEADFNAA